MPRLTSLLFTLALTASLSAQTPEPPKPTPASAAPLPDPFAETEQALVQSTMLRLALKQAAGVRVLGLGRTRDGVARAVLALADKRTVLLARGDTFRLVAANGVPIEFTVSGISERGVAVQLADGTQTLIE